MANPNNGQVQTFLDVCTPGNHNYGNIATLMNLFAPDSPNPKNPTSPIVGVTDHANGNNVLGPGFVGRTEITTMFTTLFNAFSKLLLKPCSGEEWLYSSDGNTIAVRVTSPETKSETGTRTQTNIIPYLFPNCTL